MPLSITIGNLDKVLAEIKAYPQDIKKIINNEFVAFGDNTANDMKRLAPKNEGALVKSINTNIDLDQMVLHVGAYIEYAAYLEFGTKSFAEAYVASLPEDWQAFAAEHQGGGEGTFAELLQAIMKWVELKGITAEPSMTEQGDEYLYGKLKNSTPKQKSAEEQQQQLAYLIARKIVRDGIKAQPYFYPAFEKNKLELIENLKAALHVK
jgi:hypothetical protein